MRGRLLLSAVIFAVVALVFSGAAKHEFIRLDDYDYVVTNTHIRDGLTLEAVKWAFLDAGYAANWHPLTWISHAADISLASALGIDWRCGEDEAKLGFVTRETGGLARLAHIENVVLHGVNAVLLFWLVLAMHRSCADRLTGLGAAGAAALALLWAVHPLRTEVVAWVAERKELLSCLFMLLTLLCWVMGIRDWGLGIEKRCRKCLLPLSLFFFALALLAKPVAVSLPVVIFAYEWAMRREGFRKSVRRAVPFAALSAAVCALTILAQRGAMRAADNWTLANRVLAVVEAPVVYLRQTFWPFGLTIDYPVPDWSSWPLFATGTVLLIGMGVVVAGQFWSRFRGRDNAALAVLFFAVAWMYVGLLPMIGIVKVGYEPHNDRYTYWIAAGGAVVLGWAIAAVPRLAEIRYRRHSVVALIAVLSFLSIVQTATWKDSETVLARAVRANHDPWYAQTLAEVMAIRHPERVEESVEILREVLDSRHSSEARAVLAYQLAAYATGVKRTSITGAETSAFSEARMLADYALEEKPSEFSIQFACAAFAHADYREERYESALKWMERAIGQGYEPEKHCVRLDKWKEKARVSK